MIPVSLLPNCNSVVKCRQKDRIPQVVSKLPAISALPGLSLSYDAILTCRINVTARRYKNIDGESPLIPRIEEVGSARPYWSVMIPTYNPRADYFEENPEQGSAAGPGPEQMQIEVVYDCSEHNTFRSVG